MFEGVLPIGTVVLLKNSTKRVMIIGVCQKDSSGKVWDYSAVLYPEGYLGSDQSYLFDSDQIERIFAIGYQDEEQFEFKVKADALMKKIRDNQNQ
ncbi:MAG: DUF4176 domain-containing protein [Porcipelethomonas sp.]